ncbi:hypothetical protein D8674_030756 [Pyrus ussuriensis x Pyrus communis]|uniref:Endonuclease/exonuclease/phosphatase domain-containing protein n=1 Tax=Pyrus ussuriensis x Pyrus communis TaxID=2448454 RepID=A0A5N5EWU3_9ROSA|nr:hypothetical protein D8674_030756 [Pyrus ussuriensis x Pyrus communis]
MTAELFSSQVNSVLLASYFVVSLEVGDRDLQCDSGSVVRVCSSVEGVEFAFWLTGFSLSMAQREVEDLVVHLEESMELTSMKSGIRLIGVVLAEKTLNKWGIRNVLRSSWREFGDIQIKCGRIRHVNTECSFGYTRGGSAGYGEWTRTAAIRDIQERRSQLLSQGERRLAGTSREASDIGPQRSWDATRDLEVKLWVPTLKSLHVDQVIEEAPEEIPDRQRPNFLSALEGNNILSTAGLHVEAHEPVSEGVSPTPYLQPAMGTNIVATGSLEQVGSQERAPSNLFHSMRLKRRADGKLEGASGSKRRRARKGEGSSSSVISRGGKIEGIELGDVSWNGKGCYVMKAICKKFQLFNYIWRILIREGCVMMTQVWVVAAVFNQPSLISRQGAMIYLLWNCRGLGSDRAVRALHGLITRYRPVMVFLSETYMKTHNVAALRRMMGYANGFDVPPVGTARGLSFWWDNGLKVRIPFSSNFVIDSYICLDASQRQFRVTWMYGTLYRDEKKEFWKWMETTFGPCDRSWLCEGDFNEFLWKDEKSGGHEVRINHHRYLLNFMISTKLFDLGFKGPKFTWRGTRAGQLMEERIDRCLINVKWQEWWLDTTVTHGLVMGSNHCPLIVNCEPVNVRGKCPFRFEAFWMKDKDCREIIKTCWDEACDGDLLLRWQKKINLCRGRLKEWSKRKFRQRKEKIEQLTQHLGVLQNNWKENVEQIQEVSIQLDRLWEQEEIYWKQRSRIKWVQQGDADTSIFHQSTMQRRRQNKIVKLMDVNRQWVEKDFLITLLNSTSRSYLLLKAQETGELSLIALIGKELRR